MALTEKQFFTLSERGLKDVAGNDILIEINDNGYYDLIFLDDADSNFLKYTDVSLEDAGQILQEYKKNMFAAAWELFKKLGKGKVTTPFYRNIEGLPVDKDEVEAIKVFENDPQIIFDASGRIFEL